MSSAGEVSRGRPRARALSIGRADGVLIVLLALGAALYLQQAFQWFMYDDEGSYAYAAWRISLGELPYRDFLTPQMPAFLYWGGFLVRFFGRSYVALRVPSMLATLGAAGLLYAINRELFNRIVALVAVALFLVDPNVFHNARFYRPEAYMLLLDLAGVYCLVLAEKRGRLRYLWLGSVFFGLAAVTKLFGLLPLAGCYLYLAYAWWRERRPLKPVLQEGLALGLPALLLMGAVGVLFTGVSPYFLTAVFEHHTMQGAGMDAGERIVKALSFFREYFLLHPALVLLAAWGTASLRHEKAPRWLLAWQLPTALFFFVISRSLLYRHLTYLAPATATLAALALVALVSGQWRLRLVAAALALATLWPATKLDAADANRKDPEPYKLAALVQKLTTSEELVMADFPGINFAAGRRTTYWAAGISAGAATSGQIRGATLNREMEQDNVGMVIINTLHNAHQMTGMVDYPVFRRYVQTHFTLVAKYQCAYEQFEVYARHDSMPLQPVTNFHDQLMLTGARLEGRKVRSGSTLSVDTRWQALTRMASDYSASLCLVDAAGRLWAEDDGLIKDQFSHVEVMRGLPWEIVNDYPTSTWVPQQVVLQRRRLAVGSEVPSGSYYLVARVHDASSGCALSAGTGPGPQLAGGDVIIATVQVVGRVPGPKVNELPIAARLDQRMAEGVDLVGVGPLPGKVTAGGRLGLEFFWRAGEQGSRDYRLELRLRQGAVVRQRWAEEPVEGFPTSVWRKDEVLLGHYALPLAGDLEAGSYALEVQLVDGQGQAVGLALPLPGEVRLERPVAVPEGQIAYPLAGVSLGGTIELLGYDLRSDQVWARDAAGLTLYWRPLAPVGKDYKVFVHLLDGSSQIQAQCDTMAGGGAMRTSQWRAGEVVADHYEVWVPKAKGKELQIEVGLYDPASGQRLPVERNGQPAGEDRVLLPVKIAVR